MIPAGSQHSDSVVPATTAEESQSSEMAAQYLLLLGACTAVVQSAPRDARQCSADEVERLFVGGLVQVVSVLASLFPGGVEEMFYFLLEEQQKAGWGSNCRD